MLSPIDITNTLGVYKMLIDPVVETCLRETREYRNSFTTNRQTEERGKRKHKSKAATPISGRTHDLGSDKCNSKMKSRKAITNTQRRALRKWFFDPETKDGAKTHADASLWWERTYKYYLNSSTVSEILSYKYDPLDDASADPAYCQTDTRKRQRRPKWETLEEELIKWVFWYESIAGEGSVTGSMLRYRGTELWNTLECHKGMSMPKWSEGWQCRFKSRYAERKQRMLDEMMRNSSGGGPGDFYDGSEFGSPRA
jgi:hypothetical protein